MSESGKQLRDIRADIRDRIAGIEEEVKDLRERLNRLISLRQSAMTILEEEEARWQMENQSELFEDFEAGTHKEPWEIVVDVLSDGATLNAGEIASVIEDEYGFDFGGRSPGRVVQAMLMNLQRQRKVVSVDGRWKLAVPENHENNGSRGNGHPRLVPGVDQGGR